MRRIRRMPGSAARTMLRCSPSAQLKPDRICLYNFILDRHIAFLISLLGPTLKKRYVKFITFLDEVVRRHRSSSCWVGSYTSPIVQNYISRFSRLGVRFCTVQRREKIMFLPKVTSQPNDQFIWAMMNFA